LLVCDLCWGKLATEPERVDEELAPCRSPVTNLSLPTFVTDFETLHPTAVSRRQPWSGTSSAWSGSSTGPQGSLGMSGSTVGDPEGGKGDGQGRGRGDSDGGEVDRPRPAEHANGEVVQAGHDVRAGAGADLGAISAR
jgi:hypothetical protein